MRLFLHALVDQMNFLHATGLSLSIPVGVCGFERHENSETPHGRVMIYRALFKLTVDLFVGYRHERSLLSFIV